MYWKNATDWATISVCCVLLRNQLHGAGANVAFYNNNAAAKNCKKEAVRVNLIKIPGH